MKLPDWIFRWIPGTEPAPRVETMREAAGTYVDADEDQWRKLTGDANRDLSPMTQDRMQKMAAYLWESNLMANRLIELMVAYLLAEGVKLTCKDDLGQKTLNRFWRDPINNMPLKLAEKVRELALFGEQCYPVFLNEVSGAVRLGYLDPSLIATVVMDPDNASQPIGVVTLYPGISAEVIANILQQPVRALILQTAWRDARGARARCSGVGPRGAHARRLPHALPHLPRRRAGGGCESDEPDGGRSGRGGKPGRGGGGGGGRGR